jgi:hypothetical protein
MRLPVNSVHAASDDVVGGHRDALGRVPRPFRRKMLLDEPTLILILHCVGVGMPGRQKIKTVISNERWCQLP